MIDARLLTVVEAWTSLPEPVRTGIAAAQGGVALDAGEFVRLIDDGLVLAASMQDEEKLDFFTRIKRKLTEGGD